MNSAVVVAWWSYYILRSTDRPNAKLRKLIQAKGTFEVQLGLRDKATGKPVDNHAWGMSWIKYVRLYYANAIKHTL